MAKEAAFSCVLLLMSCVLFPSVACSQTADCSNAVGQWEFRIFGRDCKGYQEEGKFLMTVDADCNLKIDILSDIPYAEKYLVTNKSLTVENDRFYATVDFTVDKCSMVVLEGKIIDGKRIEGTYRYEDGGSGTFKAVKKKSGRRKPKAEPGAPASIWSAPEKDESRYPDYREKPWMRQ
ncbi:MAG: hypothetical protein AB1512_00090 [Thermodesulfobacteriota bacterium]